MARCRRSNVKFNFPMAWVATQLAWNYLEFPGAFTSSGNNQHFLNNLRYVNDYFIRSHTSDNVLWAQVGEGHQDHNNYWYPPEASPARRLSLKINNSKPGTELAAETAAAMAAASIVFKNEDAANYSATLLDHARRLYTFADTYRGKYSNVVNAYSFYRSFSGYQDELVWGALSL
ncbi:MAG: glycoside hydrolase family 9 protein [Trueperaceae bacterium]